MSDFENRDLNNDKNENDYTSNGTAGDNFYMYQDKESNDSTQEIPVQDDKDSYSSYEFNSQNYDSKEERTMPIISRYSGDNEDMTNTQKKRKRKGLSRVLSYVLVGVFSATIGGGAVLASTLYLLPNSSAFKNTPLYKSVAASTNTSKNGNSQSAASYNVDNTSTETKSSGLSVTQIAKKVGPAVVGVSTKSITSTDDFWGGQNEVDGIGSGMIINEQGYVLTNYHVVKDAQSVKVILYTGKEVSAKVVNWDQAYDVAIVKITDNVKMPGVVELGDSDSLQVGETTVAIGNPLGKEFLGTVTSGIVSAVNRTIDSSNKLKYIQTDTAINSGNSGGPLLNSKGQVIGINTAKINNQSSDTTVEGMGFAIPINTVKSKIKNLSKPILLMGISAYDYNKQQFAQYNYPKGVYVQTVEDFSPAEKAGLRTGDIILKFDGKAVSSVSEINELKAKHKAGDKVSIEISRDGKKLNLTLGLVAK
ncbi:S1C family serine protease [Clostridium oryzae]|uniref:Serine protease Do-like HtrA n=1 Tax=Clostridium oryzae TaxID=1450648 RepID=A0A1V4IP12_9CLOT|nr:trypsin-like peptidase domain-containing protein [Clostridium oryzae]OPJ61535.1 serine protease Do-like HtrA [Clostridium oryzae]